MFVSENPIGNAKIKASALEDAKLVLSSCKAKGVSKNEVVSLIDEIYRHTGMIIYKKHVCPSFFSN